MNLNNYISINYLNLGGFNLILFDKQLKKLIINKNAVSLIY
ncbi:hypothetical protein PALI_a0969 [Pseudoalteromonas aliena SW19]|uniref:Uncharacterized protein n=1 Tax=Pseudoalteromonas aliena SW19 TaxID=1314866 RepID=A0ABR9DZW8_9GAMM|nr:hypothetical protein [Pseudoalteromonas aliena SW19]